VTVNELGGVAGLVLAVAGAGAAWGAARAQAAAHATQLAELNKRAAAMGARIGGLKTAITVLAANQGLIERLAPFLDGTRRKTAAQGIELLTAADSGEHETE
jgi:hypothetical protein